MLGLVVRCTIRVFCGLQVPLIPNIQNSGDASLRQLSNTAIGPDIQPEDAEDSSDGDESDSSGTKINDRGQDAAPYYRGTRTLAVPRQQFLCNFKARFASPSHHVLRVPKAVHLSLCFVLE
jgi:hypothetical protein